MRPSTEDTLVIDDPTAPALPFGCIGPEALILLAAEIQKLRAYHDRMGGVARDRPCLRRVEASGSTVIAHVSTGPAVGGSWDRLELSAHGWRLLDR